MQRMLVQIQMEIPSIKDLEIRAGKIKQFIKELDANAKVKIDYVDAPDNMIQNRPRG